MDLLKVKAESLPKRCEVCHQADYFDAPTNICTRCKDIGSIQIKQYIKDIGLPTFLTNILRLSNTLDNIYLRTIRWRMAGILALVSFTLFIMLNIVNYWENQQIQEAIKRGEEYWGFEYSNPYGLFGLLFVFFLASVIITIYLIISNIYNKLQD